MGSPATHVLLLKVPYDDCSIYADNIPTATFAMFMMMFAAITPLLMTGMFNIIFTPIKIVLYIYKRVVLILSTGSFAERVKWKAFFTLTVLWEILVFYPVVCN